MKPLMVAALAAALEQRGLSQAKAAPLVGVNQPRLSGVLRGDAAASAEQLGRFLLRLGYDVEITVKPAPRSRHIGRFSVRGP